MRSFETSRRQFIQKLIATVATVPFLPRDVFGGPSHSPNLITIISPYGQFAENWMPKVEKYKSDSNEFRHIPLRDIKGPISKILDRRFDGLRHKANLILGMDAMSNYGHNYCIPTTGSALSSFRVYDSAPNFPYSFDNVIDEFQRRSQPGLHKLNVTPSLTPVNHSFSWNGQQIPPTWKPEQVYDLVFKHGSEKLVTDEIHQEFKRVHSQSRLASQSMDQFLESLLKYEKQNQLAQTCKIGNRSIASSDLSASFESHSDLIVSMLNCGLTKNVTMNVKYFDDQHINEAYWHGISHGMDDKSSRISKYGNQWISQKVLNLVKKLEQQTTGDGKSLLDNTLVIWVNELSQGMYHSVENLPLVTFGSAGGKLKTGHLVDFRRKPFKTALNNPYTAAVGRPYNQFLVTVLDAFGLKPKDYERNGVQGFGEWDPVDNLWDQFKSKPRAQLEFLKA